MVTPKKYFHDRLVLLLLSVNAFLAVATCSWFVLRLSAGRSSSYIVQYRANLSLNTFKTGGVADLLGFIIFIALILAVNTALSLRVYRINRQLAVVVLVLAVILLVLAAIVSNALLVLR